MEYKSDRRPIKENDLVSEQPGFFLLFLGVFFSIIVGLSIRTAAQSSWFGMRLAEVVANVGKEWRIQHGAVGLYFKEGIAPAIGVYVEDVKIASESSCYMKAGGFAQRVNIPLSLVRYIIAGQLVSEIDIEDFKIEITERSPVCDKPTTSSGKEETDLEPRRRNQITIVDQIEKETLRNEIERININKLEIYYPDEKYDYFFLNDIVIENRSSHPKILFMEGVVDLAPFSKTGEGKKSASLKIEYNEFPEKIIKSNLLGSLREGFFSLQVVNRLEDKRFQLQTELKNVSLALLSGFIKDTQPGVDLKSNWLSSKIYVEGTVDALSASTVEIKDVLVYGDLGEFSVETLNFPKGIASSPNPFGLKMKSADLSKIFSLSSGRSIPNQVASFGLMDGQIDFLSELSVKLNGSVKNLEIIFSAQSNRKVETLHIGKVTGGLLKKNFVLDAQNIKNSQGNVDGGLHLNSEDMKSFNLEMHLKNLKLSNAVTELLTGTSVPIIFDDLSLKANGEKKNVMYKATGKLKSISHRFFDMANVVFSVSGGISKNQEIDVRADSWQNTEMLQKRLADLGLNTPALISKLKVRLAQFAEYKQLKVETQSSFEIDATLRGDNSLDGVIVTKDQEWKVYGTRDNFKIDKK